MTNTTNRGILFNPAIGSVSRRILNHVDLELKMKMICKELCAAFLVLTLHAFVLGALAWDAAQKEHYSVVYHGESKQAIVDRHTRVLVVQSTIVARRFYLENGHLVMDETILPGNHPPLILRLPLDQEGEALWHQYFKIS
ncbi:MAG: hypothetical protein JWO40_752 [Candidatus Doudnabacteria bacterium]|nr:hypothetical protein [Candidatus Doudnabacteria bacterium]